MHIYWASVFILPKRIIQELEERMRKFLWSQGNNIKGKAKVNWKSVCMPKTEGGLGIRRVVDMNNALMATHIWSLLSNRESLWVKWVHSYHIQDRSFWEIPVKSNISWSWRKLLSLRPLIRDYVWTKVGDGTKTFVWFDKWDNICPISMFITPRRISNAGFRMNTKLAEVYIHGEWRWPIAWINQFAVLNSLRDMELASNRHDELVWRSRLGVESEFNTALVWDDIRQSQNEVSWANLVWFP
ncbi:uncharacterized mitochondrial protein AtMg00310-like [Helianthus annuus]|uniref:uncharacterized mitochondrial protein AtMg00310-like n=1 Tax=Helianthus annuus TaxID=4232 RepID=UPI000B905912|nr:uncharacterized mitochondrial protein AtMg00310-like [Helianthus annuus]